MVSVMYITETAKNSFFRICLGKMKSDARPDQLIAFTRCLHKTLPIEDRDLLSAAFNQAGTFHRPGSIRDAWPLDPQHFGEQALSNKERVTVTAVAHHEKPTR